VLPPGVVAGVRELALAVVSARDCDIKAARYGQTVLLLKRQVAGGDIDAQAVAAGADADLDLRLLPVRRHALVLAWRMQTPEIDQRSRNGVRTDKAEDCNHGQSLCLITRAVEHATISLSVQLILGKNDLFREIISKIK
jgi:hypothetical protein